MRRTVWCSLRSAPQRGLAPVLFATLLLVPAAALSAPAIGLEWSPGDLEVLLVAELTADQGLEFIGVDASATVSMYRLADGQFLFGVPAIFNNPQASFLPRDVDNDGLAELVCTLPLGAGSYRLGLLDPSAGMAPLWAPLVVADGLTQLELMNLNPSEPNALVLVGQYLRIVSVLLGTVLYDGSQDPELDPRWRVAGALIDDFDNDGFDEVLLTLNNNGLLRTALIGDLTAGTSSVETPRLGQIQLHQNSPNPFNGGTTISYELRDPGRVRLRIYDTAGRQVRTMVDGRVAAGSHQQNWNGRDDNERAVASGIYFYELEVEGERRVRKLVQVR